MKRFPSYRSIALCTLGLACSDDPRIIGGPEPPATETPAAGGSGEPTAPPDPENAPPPVDDPEDPDDGSEAGDPDMPSGAGDPDVKPVVPPDEPPPAAPFTTPRGPCDISQRVGRFSVEKQTDFGVVQGTVSDGVVPTAIPRLALEQGSCRLFERRNLACVPACVGAQTCGEDGTCIPYPRQVSAGEVVIAGLTKETRMSPLQPGNTYFAPGADNPPFAVGSEVVLSAAGEGDMAPFQLFGLGSEPLSEPPAWVIQAGTDLALAWAAPSANVGTSVLVELTIDQHGISPLSLSCEFEDTGSASVPGSIIDELIGAGVSGFPNGRLTRRTADHVELGAGCVELVVGSPLAASISVAGYTPCNTTGECPDGQTCNVPLQRCE